MKFLTVNYFQIFYSLFCFFSLKQQQHSIRERKTKKRADAFSSNLSLIRRTSHLIHSARILNLPKLCRKRRKKKKYFFFFPLTISFLWAVVAMEWEVLQRKVSSSLHSALSFSFPFFFFFSKTPKNPFGIIFLESRFSISCYDTDNEHRFPFNMKRSSSLCDICLVEISLWALNINRNEAYLDFSLSHNSFLGLRKKFSMSVGKMNTSFTFNSHVPTFK